MLDDPKEAGHYMQLRAREKSKPVHNLADNSYSYIGKRKPEPAVPDIVSSNRFENKRVSSTMMIGLNYTCKYKSNNKRAGPNTNIILSG